MDYATYYVQRMSAPVIVRAHATACDACVWDSTDVWIMRNQVLYSCRADLIADIGVSKAQSAGLWDQRGYPGYTC